ncbi:MAG: YicC family protein [Clostridia bacterium]|nr:YicC family protein [Clostridia bacterium]
MIRSMTGYGRGEVQGQGRNLKLEIKSVNHRYSDINLKLPRTYLFLEEYIKGMITQVASRGKIDFFLTVEYEEGEDKQVAVDKGLAVQYINAIREIGELCGAEQNLSAYQISRFPDVLTLKKAPDDEEILKAEVTEALKLALDEFVAMREREGVRIAETLKAQAAYILEIVATIEKTMPETVENYRNRLTEKVTELLGSASVDQSRILTETAIFADKICTDEETVRLKSHIKEFGEIISSDGPCGRKLDFLMQEMNREINTIGSKCNNIDISKLVVEVKSELEKLREQIQNIE